jgi:hypothetical protein
MPLQVFLQVGLYQALEQAGYTKDSAMTTEDFSKLCFANIENRFLNSIFFCSLCQHQSTVTIVQLI